MKRTFGILVLAVVIGCTGPSSSPSRGSAKVHPTGKQQKTASDTAVSATARPSWSEQALVRAMRAGHLEDFLKALPPYPVRFSADGYLEKEDPLLTLAQWQKDTLILFGAEAGTGTPIRLSPRRFFKKFLALPWAQGERVTDSVPTACRGNTINNIADFYGPDAHYVTYCLPGSEKYAGMDWAALRVVWRHDSLLAIVRDAWTP